ncbi:hypothetical protein EBR25_10200 [bacterium]|nr:hypothetical protein [bacterium]
MLPIDEGKENEIKAEGVPPAIPGAFDPSAPLDERFFPRDTSTSSSSAHQIHYPPIHLPTGIPRTFETGAQNVAGHVVHKIEALKPRRRLASREVAVLALEGSGSLRPGFLGKERAFFEQQWNEWFGNENWSMEHLFGPLRLPQKAALALYENSYVDFFKKHPQIATFITKNYRDVYDNSTTNVESGTDYEHQEVRHSHGVHLQDIAIRRALKTCGLSFNQDAAELLQVRGGDSNGWYLSPGVIPFTHDIAYDPVSSWCNKGSIEEFYQSTRFCFVKGFGEHSSHSLWQTHVDNPSVVEDRIAARFLLRMLPSMEAQQVSLPEMQVLPWSFDSQSLPLSAEGVPAHRPFSADEQYSIIKKTVSMLSFLSNKEEWTGTTTRKDYPDSLPQLPSIAPFARTHKSVKQFREITRKLTSGLEITEEELERFPEFQHLSGWTKHLHHVADRIKKHDGGVVFLARDALVLLEYMKYRDAIAGRNGDYSVAYLPGTTVTNSGTSSRRQSLPMEELVTEVTNMYEHVRSLSLREHEPNGLQTLFSQRIYAYLDHACSEDSLTICRGIYKQATQNLKVWPQSLLIIDSDGTGKTAFFVKTVIEYFAEQDGYKPDVQVFLGRKRCNALGLEAVSDTLGAEADISFRDLHFPFRFHDVEGDKPLFKTVGSVRRHVSLLLRSMKLYNTAIKDFRQENPLHS